MDDKELFNPVLDQNEEILKIYRPNKLRAYFNLIIFVVFIAIIFVPIMILSYIQEPESAPTMWVCVGLFAFILVIYLIMMILWCKKTVYAVTTKRIIIRTGYIGVDYKALDFNTIGAVTVNVNWLDKLLRKNTGYISFGSMASPMINTANYKFSFFYIEKPYEVYKEVKAIIDSVNK